MATLFDTALLEKFSIIFTWILIFAVVYGVAEMTKIIQSKPLVAIIAFCIATLAIITPAMPKILSSLAPWIVIIAIVILFLLMLANFLGIPTIQIVSGLGGRGAIWLVMAPLLIAVIFSLSSVFGQNLLEQRTSGNDTTIVTATSSDTSSSHDQSVILALTNPKVLGVVIILLIAMFAILFLTGTASLPIPRWPPQ
jgi:hypothetical protein